MSGHRVARVKAIAYEELDRHEIDAEIRVAEPEPGIVVIWMVVGSFTWSSDYGIVTRITKRLLAEVDGVDRVACDLRVAS